MDYFKEFKTNIAYHFSEVLNYPFAKPYWIYISLSHRCVYKCKMCGVVNILKNHELSKDIVKKSLDDIAKWKWGSVVTFTGGEPFLREDIFEILEYSVKKNINTEIVSNGYFIDEKMADRIVHSGIKNIAISLDGATEATHDSIRQKGSFKKAIRALEMLVKKKKGVKGGPQISVWTTIMKENVTELFDIAPLTEDIGVECLVYHPVVVSQDDMQNTSPNAPFWINGDNLRILKEQIDRIVDYKNKYGLIAFILDPYLWVDHFKGVVTKKDWKCNPFVFANIGPDGEMRSCGAAFGNVKNTSLDECLETREAYDARKLMKACQKPCLQTCWGHPESDSLYNLVNDFMSKVNNDGKSNKQKNFKKALRLLAYYQEILEKNG